MRKATCKKGTEYCARAERALMFCVLSAFELLLGKCSARAAGECYRPRQHLSLAR
jgi:hypothetical protein